MICFVELWTSQDVNSFARHLQCISAKALSVQTQKACLSLLHSHPSPSLSGTDGLVWVRSNKQINKWSWNISLQYKLQINQPSHDINNGQGVCKYGFPLIVNFLTQRWIFHDLDHSGGCSAEPLVFDDAHLWPILHRGQETWPAVSLRAQLAPLELWGALEWTNHPGTVDVPMTGGHTHDTNKTTTRTPPQ
jgi:hypothetical protein